MKIWSAINTNLTMALNLIYPKLDLNFLHNSFTNIQTKNYRIHISTTPTSAILSITHLNKLQPSIYTKKLIPKLETIVFTNTEESVVQTVKQILLKIKPLLDET